MSENDCDFLTSYYGLFLLKNCFALSKQLYTHQSSSYFSRNSFAATFNVTALKTNNEREIKPCIPKSTIYLQISKIKIGVDVWLLDVFTERGSPLENV